MHTVRCVLYPLALPWAQKHVGSCTKTRSRYLGPFKTPPISHKSHNSFQPLPISSLTHDNMSRIKKIVKFIKNLLKFIFYE